VGNLFAQSALPADFDLTQYNSPSFATAHPPKPVQTAILTQQAPKQYLTQEKSPEPLFIHHSLKQKKNKFLALQDDALITIIEYLGERLPMFMFTNRTSFKQVLQA